MNDEQRQKAMEELTRISQEMGLYDVDPKQAVPVEGRKINPDNFPDRSKEKKD